MATSTPNLNLILPDYSDKADISVLNDNFQKIDEYCANGGVSNEDLQNAVKAANAWANATASAESVSADKEADVNLTEGDNSKNLHFSIPRGQPGVLISETKPTDPNVKVWIKPDGEPNEFEQLKSDVSSLKDQKANVIIDTSARAASHELHAQDGDMKVTLYGKTTETGSGDKSPDNPHVISGVDVANVHAGGKNLFCIDAFSTNTGGMTVSTDGRGRFAISGTTSGNGYLITWKKLPRPITILPGLSVVANNPTNAQITVCFELDNGEEMISNIPAGNKKHTIIKESRHYKTIEHFRLYAGTGVVFSGDVEVMLTYSEDTTFEPYTANVITPALLPDGAPLHGNGTVDDTVENDVLSGCDKKIVLDGSEGWAFWDKFFYLKLPDSVGNAAFCDRFFNASASTYTGAIDINTNTKELRINSGHTSAAEFKAYLAANPLTVFYRSTDYTPENDLRVCKVERHYRKVELTGAEYWAMTGTDFYTNMTTTPGALNRWSDGVQVCDRYKAAVRDALTDGGFGISDKPYFRDLRFSDATAWKAHLSEQYDAGTPVTIVYQATTPEIYMTDPLPLRKPTGIMPVTVTGSGETSVQYPHDTKHYIDQKFDALAAALLS